MPRQHGAWAMLYAPAVLAFAGFGRFPPGPGLAFAVALTAAFFAMHAGTLVVRGRPVWGWFVLELLLATGAGAWLVLRARRHDLVALAVPVAIFGAVYLRWVARPGRAHRTVPAELVTVAALTLSAPAAAVVSRGHLDAVALELWAGCFAYYAVGIFHVRSRVLAGKAWYRGDPAALRTIGRRALSWHAGLGSLVLLFALTRDTLAGALWCLIAYAPVVIRGVVGGVTLAPRAPNLRRVGFTELAYTVVFVVAGALALRAGVL